jgi:hypothetical protein
VIAAAAVFDTGMDVIQLRGNFLLRYAEPLEVPWIAARRLQFDVSPESIVSTGFKEASKKPRCTVLTAAFSS